MQSHYAGTHVVVVHAVEAGIEHHSFEGFLVGMHTDGFGQVLIAVGIFGDEFAHQRQELEGIEVVGRSKRLGHFGKFQHEQCTAWLEHAVHFFEGGVFMRHVAQAEGYGNEVEIVIREGEFFGIAYGHGQEQAFVEQAVATHAEHGGVDVGEPDFAVFAHAFGPAAREVARAAGNVEHFTAFGHAGGGEGEVFPHAVQAAGHHVVHDVVFFGDGVEYFGHFGGFFAFVYGAVAEMGLLVGHYGAFR